MFRLVVNKKYVSERLLKAFDTKPIMLMPEDPLFLPDDVVDGGYSPLN
jgi:bleomycin hydrolase